MRESLTRIYQRHCNKEGEGVEDAIKRFGVCNLLRLCGMRGSLI